MLPPGSKPSDWLMMEKTPPGPDADVGGDGGEGEGGRAGNGEGEQDDEDGPQESGLTDDPAFAQVHNHAQDGQNGGPVNARKCA
jgi:hypothetical protein